MNNVACSVSHLECYLFSLYHRCTQHRKYRVLTQSSKCLQGKQCCSGSFLWAEDVTIRFYSPTLPAALPNCAYDRDVHKSSNAIPSQVSGVVWLFIDISINKINIWMLHILQVAIILFDSMSLNSKATTCGTVTLAMLQEIQCNWKVWCVKQC